MNPLKLLRLLSLVQCEEWLKAVFFFLPEICIFCYDFPGFQVYLVGGCVRDLILDRIPKDFDVITTAELKEV